MLPQKCTKGNGLRGLFFRHGCAFPFVDCGLELRKLEGKGFQCISSKEDFTYLGLDIWQELKTLHSFRVCLFRARDGLVLA